MRGEFVYIAVREKDVKQGEELPCTIKAVAGELFICLDGGYGVFMPLSRIQKEYNMFKRETDYGENRE